jgi:hypothetical protein
MLKKCVAVLLIGSMSLVQIRPVLAQVPVAPPVASEPSSKSNVSECIELGRNDGRHVSTGGAFTIGLASGVLLGLIGTGIAWACQGEPEPSALGKYESSDATCRMAYADAFGETGKKQKRSAALVGGLLGTAVLVVIVVAANSGSSSGSGY